MKKIFDLVELWLVGSGFLDQLALLATSTSALRAIVMWAAGLLVAKGVMSGSPSEALIGAGVTILNGSLTMFINYVRTKHAANVQAALGEKKDSFIGPECVQAAKDLAAKTDSK